MPRRFPKKDVVIVGFGWTGAIMANELTDEGLDVIAIERGPWRDAPMACLCRISPRSSALSEEAPS